MRAIPHAAYAAAALLASACGGKPPAAPVATPRPGRRHRLHRPCPRRPPATWLGGRRWAVLAAPDEKVAHRGRRRPQSHAARGARQGAPQPGHPVPRGRYALRRRLGVAAHVPLDPRRPLRRIGAGLGRGARRAAARAGRSRAFLSRGRRPGPGPTGRATAIRPPWCVPAPGADGSTRSRGWRRSTSPRSWATPAAGSSAGCSAASDRWGVLPDGSLWVARVYENRVDWRDPDGKWTRGSRCPTGCSR